MLRYYATGEERKEVAFTFPTKSLNNVKNKYKSIISDYSYVPVTTLSLQYPDSHFPLLVLTNHPRY